MQKIQYSVYKRETGNAAGKAESDCYDILCECGYSPSYKTSDQKWIRFIRQYFSIKRIKRDDILVVQYPVVSHRLMPVLLKQLGNVSNTIAIIHDIPAIQRKIGEIDRQIDELNHFKYIIAHNDHMIDKLKEYGCNSRMISLEAFDYLHDVDHPTEEHIYDGTIAVAGSIPKNRYLEQIKNIDRYKFYFYGKTGGLDFPEAPNIEYLGLLPSDEIPYLLRGSYGLIWAGESIETCSGNNGEYLKIIDPHKMSLYIAAGIPVITWKRAAIADFVVNNDIGIVIDSLYELNDIDLSHNYEERKRNVNKIKMKLANGEFLKEAIRKIELILSSESSSPIVQSSVLVRCAKDKNI